MSDKKQPKKINDEKLDQVRGGVGMLLPAVQAAREAARSTQKKTTNQETTTQLSSSNGGG